MIWTTVERFKVGKTGAQSAAVNRVEAERERLPFVAGAGESTAKRLMIEHDIAVVDKREFIGREIELASRYPFSRLLPDLTLP